MLEPEPLDESSSLSESSEDEEELALSRDWRWEEARELVPPFPPVSPLVLEVLLLLSFPLTSLGRGEERERERERNR